MVVPSAAHCSWTKHETVQTKQVPYRWLQLFPSPEKRDLPFVLGVKTSSDGCAVNQIS